MSGEHPADRQRAARQSAAFVFLFMAFLAAQAATGFMRTVFAGGVYPRALRAIDAILETCFVGPLGPEEAALTLLALGAAFAARIRWRDGQPPNDAG